MATSTPNLALRKPEGTDLVNVLADVSDNMDKIDAAIAFYKATTIADRIKENRVATLQSRANVAYAALTTLQDITITPGPSGLLEVTVSCGCGSGTAGGSAMMSFALSGGNTRAASDDVAVGQVGQAAANQTVYASRTSILTGLATGATVVSAVFRSGGADSAAFIHRQLSVKAL